MKYVPIEALPVSEDEREMLLSNTGIDGAVIFGHRRSVRVVAYGPGCQHKTIDGALHVHSRAHAAWSRAKPVSRLGRTGQALAMLDANPHLTPYAAAQKAGVDVAAVYRAMRRREERGSCKVCGQLLPKDVATVPGEHQH